MLSSLLGCSGPKPILYPNGHLKSVGEEAAERDVQDCREVAEKAGAEEGSGAVIGAGAGAAGGAVGGAISGDPGIGALVGAVSGFVWGLFSGLFGWMFGSSRPNQAYVNIVNRCLAEKGYEVSGWQ
ncbi:MAG TPA: glycine zipper family protein [Nitrospiraceae bacterium]|nr:glycine zipper family protein [Nitrospiraceae bacterium]